MPVISEVLGREILDSRGNPTVEVEVTLDDGVVERAIVPSGASTGEHEAVELRDQEDRYLGKGVRQAVNNVNTLISEELMGKSVYDQTSIDRRMIELDGTTNKGKLGANAILGVSLAVAKAAANSLGIPLYRYIGGANAKELPLPMMNILNGGSHADNNVDLQEFMIMPAGAGNFSQALQMGTEIFHHLKAVLKAKNYNTAVGDEGGFAPDLRSNEEALQVIIEAIEKAKYTPGDDVLIALDPASSEFYRDGIYLLEAESKPEKSPEEMVQFYADLCQKYPIISIEDGMAEDDWEGWKILTKKLGKKILIVGDDLYATNPKTIEHGISQKTSNAVLIKPNQIGTLKETFEAIKIAQNSNLTTIISHRSGETEDTFIADLAIGTNSKLIKAGAPARGERTAKYNRLLRIEELLQSDPNYVGQSKLSFN